MHTLDGISRSPGVSKLSGVELAVFTYQRKSMQNDQTSLDPLLHVDAKIFFSVLAKCLTDYLINPSVHKAGVPVFPGGLEHDLSSYSIDKAGQEQFTCGMAQPG